MISRRSSDSVLMTATRTIGIFWELWSPADADGLQRHNPSQGVYCSSGGDMWMDWRNGPAAKVEGRSLAENPSKRRFHRTEARRQMGAHREGKKGGKRCQIIAVQTAVQMPERSEPLISAYRSMNVQAVRTTQKRLRLLRNPAVQTERHSSYRRGFFDPPLRSFVQTISLGMNA